MTPRHRLLQRYPGNPVLTAADWSYTVNTAFNPGATRLRDGTTLLLCRVEDRRGMSHLCAARSANGLDGWVVDDKPALEPDTERHPEEMWGVEDARIVWLDELGRYAVTYTAYSPAGPAVSMALTEDFRTFERLGMVMPPEDKDAALFPRRFDGRWLMVHRPRTGLGSDIWLAESPDLHYWGKHRLMLSARRGPWWDANKIGLASPPIETADGWLTFYHGMRQTAAGCLYRVGVALFALDDPGECLMRSDEWLLGPETDYERQGDVGDVVFPCGHTVGDDGDSLKIYYGAADTSVGIATGRISEILQWLKGHSHEECPPQP